MTKTLCLDFGNTRLKVAVFHDAELQDVVVLDNGSIDTIQELINQYQPKHSILSSVINHDTQIEIMLQQQINDDDNFTNLIIPANYPSPLL